jgi:hypothetical protein
METQEIEFDESEHKYKRNGKLYISVNEFIKNKFSKFDPEKKSKEVANKLFRKYKKEVGKENEHDFKVQLMEYNKNKWLLAKNRGTSVHKVIDKYLKGDKDVEPAFQEVIDSVQTFMDEFGLVIYKSEYRVFDDDMQMAGTIDAVFYCPKRDCYIIVDWKFIDELTSIGRKCKNEPFVGIPDCKFSKYSIQLLLYKYMFEKRTSFMVRDCHIVFPTKDGVPYKVFDINKYDINKIVQYRIEEVKSQVNNFG